MPGGYRVRKADIARVVEFVAAVETERAKVQSLERKDAVTASLFPAGFVAGLYDMGLLKKMESGEVRAVLETLSDKRIILKLNHLPAQMKYFVYNQETILSDYRRLQVAESTIASFVQRMKNEPSLFPHVVMVGWWKMLSMSEMPASIEDFLEEGFSPKEWAMSSVRAIPRLSFSISKRFGNAGSFDGSISLLHKANLLKKVRYLSEIDRNTLAKVEAVLAWNIIEQRTPIELIRFLGATWFLILLLGDNDLIPLEQSVAINLMSLVVKSAGSLADKPSHECEDLFERFLSEMDASGADGVSNLLFLPGVI